MEEKLLRLLRHKTEEDENIPADSGPAQGDRLDQFGNAEGPAAATGKDGSGLRHAMAIGIAFDHRHHRDTGPDPFGYGAEIMSQGPAIDPDLIP